MYRKEREERQTLAESASQDDRHNRATLLPEQPQHVHEHLQTESENNFIERAQRVTRSMTRNVSEQRVRGEQVDGGEPKVWGEQTVGGVGGVELGESMYFDEPIEAELASIYPTFCSQHSCSYTYANRNAEPTEINANAKQTLMAEGTINSNYTYNKGRINQLSTLILAMITIVDEPKSIAEALNRPEKEAAEWWKSVCEEMKSWEVLQVFKLVDESELRKQGIEIIDSKVVFKVKVDEHSNPYRHKCRIVARGFQESDQGETFAPMAHPIMIRTLMSRIAIAVANGWYMKQGDVKTAYLNANLEKPVYLRPPKGIEPIIGGGKIMELRKAVYGLCASGRLWWQTFTQKNRDFGMTSITSDDCVFSIKRGDSVLIVAIVVDDVSDYGNLKYYLGVHYTSSSGDLIATQTGYLERVLKRYGMDTCKHAASPMPQKF
eukprot:2783921-Rhodomonas_salina.3